MEYIKVNLSKPNDSQNIILLTKEQHKLREYIKVIIKKLQIKQDHISDEEVFNDIKPIIDRFACDYETLERVFKYTGVELFEQIILKKEEEEGKEGGITNIDLYNKDLEKYINIVIDKKS